MSEVKNLDHIGIAVKSIEDHIPYYRDILKLKYLGTKIVESQKIKSAMFLIGEGPTVIELLEPTGDDSTISKFLEKRGEGMHHICLGVTNIEQSLSQAKDSGIKLINESPFIGARGEKVAFLHPKSTGNVLTELSEGSQEHNSH